MPGADNSDLAIIIPASAPSKRIRGIGPKCLLELPTGETILDRQIKIYRAIYPLSEIIVIVGHEKERIYQRKLEGVRFVENHLPEHNVLYPIQLGLRATPAHNIIISYGDVVFNPATVLALSNLSCSIISSSECGPDNIGCLVTEGIVEHFVYNRENRWGQIVSLAGESASLFRQLAYDPMRWNQFPFEILNELVDKGVGIRARKADMCVDIDGIKDLELIGDLQKL